MPVKKINHGFPKNIKLINVIGIISIFLLIFLAKIVPSNATARTTSCGTVGTLQNGSFETLNASNRPNNWQTTATDDAIEVWTGRSTTRTRADFIISEPNNSYTRDGTVLAELQANSNGGANQGLYQDIATTPGARIFVSFFHHARNGYGTTQTIGARAGAIPSPDPAVGGWNSTEQTDARNNFGTELVTNDVTTSDDWEEVRATFVVPTGQATTRFLFVSLQTSIAGGGNLIDNVQFTPFLACPVTRTVTFGNTDNLNIVTTSGVTYGISQSLSSITSATNPNGTAGSTSTSGNTISFTPAAAGSSQIVDYTATMTFAGTTYTDEARITYDVSATVPGAPTGLSATPSGSQVSLSWTAPTNNGGVAISDYVVEFQEGSGSWQTFSDGVSTSTSATITGLSGSSNYNFRVSAKNDGSGYSGPGTTGTGSVSETVTVTAWLPGAPTLNTPSSPSSTSVDLTWSAPANTGSSAITSYLLEYRLFSATTWTSITTGNTNTSRTVSSLSANQTYVFRISATNSQGTGTTSSTQTITLGADCSAGSSATTRTGNTVIVTFNAPTQTDSSQTNGSCTFVVPENVFALDYLVVAGGGGGSSGGGGGGGVVTSWEQSDANPMSVSAGQELSVQIGAAGRGGWGGRIRCTTYPCTITDSIGGRASVTANQDSSGQGYAATNGSNSTLGQITAIGGGAGGWFAVNASDRDGRAGGSSGGHAADRNGTTGTTSSQTSQVGAVTFGNSGGGSGGNSYAGGGGGGGAGAAGGNARDVDADTTNSFHGGGNGGNGVEIDISNSNVNYGCGGGAGVNANSDRPNPITISFVTNGGGTAGCTNAGKGSDGPVRNTNTDIATLSTTNRLATRGTDGTGGGGGGTDPEDTRGQRGGSGIVIIRYSLTDSNCPNNSNTSATTPIACPTSVTVQADGTTTSVQVRTSPISYTTSGNNPTLSVLTRPVANPTSGNLSATVSGANINISVPSGSSLVGGTYPVTYRITEGSNTSDSYILVTVEDPTQITPIVVPVDPRITEINLPQFILGNSTNVLVCVSDSNSDNYSSVPVFSAPTPIASVSASPRSSPVGISLSGTKTNVEPQTRNLKVSKSASDSRLIPGTSSRFLNVNVSNTSNGGNNSCQGGTESTIELKPVGISLVDRISLLFRR